MPVAPYTHALIKVEAMHGHILGGAAPMSLPKLLIKADIIEAPEWCVRELQGCQKWHLASLIFKVPPAQDIGPRFRQRTHTLAKQETHTCRTRAQDHSART